MTMTLGWRVFPRLYRDSVTLMAAASVAEKTPGAEKVAAMMATPGNQRIMADAGMWPADLSAAPDDLVVSIRARVDDVALALEAFETALAGGGESVTAAVAAPGTLVEALAATPGATVATVSVPGAYAPVVVEQALELGLHVFCFSDNISVDDEVRLKAIARERGLLLMGPDCGTAILDQTPLGFANVVRHGSVGIVAASGTGAQEVSVLLDRWGVGVSQLIGVGGRDLSAEVRGEMTHAALERLAADDATEVIMVVSKPPAGEVGSALLDLLADLATADRPVVACLLGAPDTGRVGGDSLLVRGTLEGAAVAAVNLLGKTVDLLEPDAPPTPTGTSILGLFTGGTLASEAKIVLARHGVNATIHDLGDDQYTAGKPHPMIDPTPRNEWIATRVDADILLVDVVLGHGSHADPAGELAGAVAAAQAARAAHGRAPLTVIASVTGTDADPQSFPHQVVTLTAAGITVAPTNAAAARIAARLTGATIPAEGVPS